MPEKVMDVGDFSGLEKDLQTQELDSPGGVASPLVYSQLLALYIYKNDTVNAKFLWKRIPPSVKTANAELAQIWAVGQKMWVRDYPGIYESLNKEWSENIKPITAATVDVTRQRAFNLVSQGYSSINTAEFSSFMGLGEDEAVQAALSRGWEVDTQAKIILPKKPAPEKDPIIPSEEQLARLTDFVSFLEK